MGGGPSSVGGTKLGPAFVWILWAVRHAVGTWTDNLPHAGGIGLSIIQSAADAVLLVAIWKRFASLPLALAVTLLVATAPYDMALTATIWNPPLAVALVKMTIALVLLGDRDGSVWWAPRPHACWRCGDAFLRRVRRRSRVVSLTARELLRAPASSCVDVRALGRRHRRARRRLSSTSPCIPASRRVPNCRGNVSYTIAHPEALRPAAAFRALAAALRIHSAATVDVRLVRACWPHVRP
jgi:hypothetical protein